MDLYKAEGWNALMHMRTAGGLNGAKERESESSPFKKEEKVRAVCCTWGDLRYLPIRGHGHDQTWGALRSGVEGGRVQRKQW